MIFLLEDLRTWGPEARIEGRLVFHSVLFVLFEFQTHVIYQIIGKHINDVLVYPIPRLENNSKGSFVFATYQVQEKLLSLTQPQ